MAVLVLPVVFTISEPAPILVFSEPVVFLFNASLPIAVLSDPVVFAFNAAIPLAELLVPSVLESSAWEPIAVFNSPTVLAKSALNPTAVLFGEKVFMLLASAFNPIAVLVESLPLPLPTVIKFIRASPPTTSNVVVGVLVLMPTRPLSTTNKSLKPLVTLKVHWSLKVWPPVAAKVAVTPLANATGLAMGNAELKLLPPLLLICIRLGSGPALLIFMT